MPYLFIKSNNCKIFDNFKKKFNLNHLEQINDISPSPYNALEIS